MNNKPVIKGDKDYPYTDLGPLPQPLPMPTNMLLGKGIERLVCALKYHGIQTDQSSEGGKGHSYPFPIVRFEGSKSEGYRALHVALTYGYNVKQPNRTWYIEKGEIIGPAWEIVLR
jgi:hypothetical protein